MPPNAADQTVIVIPGSCSLKEIKNVVRFHEAYLWKFDSSTVDGKMNKVVLTAAEDVPPDFDFAAATATVPAGKTKEWTGSLRYNGAEQQACLIRSA